MSSGYPDVAPLTLEGLSKLYMLNVVDPVVKLGMPADKLAEESFWAGAESFMSIILRANAPGGTAEESAAIIHRIFKEITARAQGQEARVTGALRNGPRN